MEGIYIHIPFCTQACRYCDFYFTVTLRYREMFVEKLLQEIILKSPEWKNSLMGSLYLGGGTPSLLSAEHLRRILETVRNHYPLQDDAEVTIECNPEDLEPDYLRFIKETGVNRISIGVQSFRDEELKLLRRSHTAQRAVRSIEDAAATGFQNITADLIYGIPGQTRQGWGKNLEEMISLPVSHISAYHLTFEPGTVLDLWRRKGRINPVLEEESVQMYRVMRQKMHESGFEHYEISNFARDGKRSRHNQLYWSGESYAGFGPGAHSFQGTDRSWNQPSLRKYLSTGEGELPPYASEELSLRDRYHDYLITTLRTRKGADPGYISLQFGASIRQHFEKKSKPFIKEGTMQFNGPHLVIDPEHWLVADLMIRSLFLD